MSERFVWTFHGHNPRTHLPIWSCRREGSGLLGYATTQEDAMQAFLDLEQELVPDPAEREVEQAIDDQLHREAFGEQA